MMNELYPIEKCMLCFRYLPRNEGSDENAEEDGEGKIPVP